MGSGMQISVEQLRRVAADLALENRVKDEQLAALSAENQRLAARVRELEPESGPADGSETRQEAASAG
jgi:cell division protein FtsB